MKTLTPAEADFSTATGSGPRQNGDSPMKWSIFQIKIRFPQELQKEISYIGWRDGSHSDASHNPHKGG